MHGRLGFAYRRRLFVMTPSGGDRYGAGETVIRSPGAPRRGTDAAGGARGSLQGAVEVI